MGRGAGGARMSGGGGAAPSPASLVTAKNEGEELPGRGTCQKDPSRLKRGAKGKGVRGPIVSRLGYLQDESREKRLPGSSS